MSESISVDLPKDGRLAGIDFGTVRVGVAICDASQLIASPHEVYQRKDAEQDKRYFDNLVETESIVGFVVGLPVHMSGDDSQKSLEARQFGKWINQTTARPVCFTDERFSTALANELMSNAKQPTKRKGKMRDMVAAQIILKSYLESSRLSNRPASLNDDVENRTS